MAHTREHTSFLSNPSGRVVEWVSWDELPCSYCNRQAGERCKDHHGNARKPHVVRLRSARELTAYFQRTGDNPIKN